MSSVNLAEEVRRIVFAFDAGDSRRDSVRELANRIAAFVHEATEALEAEKREHRDTLARLHDADTRLELARGEVEEGRADLESVAAELRRELDYKARVRAALGSVDDPRETLDMARGMRAAIDRAHADLCTAYRHWDADRDSKVGKIIGDTARALKAAIEPTGGTT